MRGGKRQGAGRKSLYDAPTKVLRIPVTQIDNVKQLLSGEGLGAYPLFTCSVSAGFPSPADDHMDCKLDLNKHLIKHPSATFFAKASGDSMLGAGIHDGDILIVDRSISASNGKIVIAAINGELTVKRYVIEHGQVLLCPENTKYKPIVLSEDSEIYIWGVVTNVIHKV